MSAEAGGSGRIATPGSRLLWAGGLPLVGLGLLTLYFFQSRVGPFNSDGASIIVQAQAMLHGNVLLSGWKTADVSFYTTELPEYMLVVALRGVRPDVVHISAALTYTLTVLLAAFLGRGRATGRAGVARALLAGAIMLAPGITGGTEVFLENPDHAGTVGADPAHPAAPGPRAGTWYARSASACCWPGSRSPTSSRSSPRPRRWRRWPGSGCSSWRRGTGRAVSSATTRCCWRRPSCRSHWPRSPRPRSACSAASGRAR